MVPMVPMVAVCDVVGKKATQAAPILTFCAIAAVEEFRRRRVLLPPPVVVEAIIRHACQQAEQLSTKS